MEPLEDDPKSAIPPEKSTASKNMRGMTESEAARLGIWSDSRPTGVRYRPPFSIT